MRVLVTRPSPRGDETAARLAELGHEAFLAPVLSIAPIADRPPPGPWDALLVTSRNAVPTLAQHRAELQGIPVFAVGARTAAELDHAGFGGVTSGNGDAAALAALVMAQVAAGARLLHAAGRDRRPEPARSLREAGYTLASWEVYAAEPIDALPEASRSALAAGELDAVLHYSPRSAAVLLRLVEQSGLAKAFAALHHLCLSPQVAAALDGIVVGSLSVAAQPSEDGLLALLDPPAARAD